MARELRFPDWLPYPGEIVTVKPTFGVLIEGSYAGKDSEVDGAFGEVRKVTISKGHIELEVITSEYEDGKRVCVICDPAEVERHFA